MRKLDSIPRNVTTPLVLSAIAVVVGLVVQPTPTVPPPPPSSISLEVDAVPLGPADRICVFVDYGSLWTDIDTIGFPVMILANISDERDVRVTIRSYADDPVIFNGILGKDEGWVRGMGEVFAGPVDGCSRMETIETGSQVRSQLSYFFIEDPNRNILNEPGDGVLVSLVRKLPGENLSLSGGMRSISTPTIAIRSPDATEQRQALGDLLIIGDTGGFVDVEQDPPQTSVDIWRNEYGGNVYWRGTTNADLRSREFALNLSFALYGAGIAFLLTAMPPLRDYLRQSRRGELRSAAPVVIEYDKDENGHRFLVHYGGRELVRSRAFASRFGAIKGLQRLRSSFESTGEDDAP